MPTRLVGPGGLSTGLPKTVLESALLAEFTVYLRYDKHDRMGRDGQNSRRVLSCRRTVSGQHIVDMLGKN